MRRLVFFLVLLVFSIGCRRSVTPAELEGSRRAYPHCTRAQAVLAAGTVLATLGFHVTVSDNVTGLVRTSPRRVAATMVAVHGDFLSLGFMFEDEIAWDLEIQGFHNEAVVILRPRFTRNGEPLPEERIDAQYFNASVDNILARIAEEIRLQPKQAPKPPTPTPDGVPTQI